MTAEKLMRALKLESHAHCTRKNAKKKHRRAVQTDSHAGVQPKQTAEKHAIAEQADSQAGIQPQQKSTDEQNRQTAMQVYHKSRELHGRSTDRQPGRFTATAENHTRVVQTDSHAAVQPQQTKETRSGDRQQCTITAERHTRAVQTDSEAGVQPKQTAEK